MGIYQDCFSSITLIVFSCCLFFFIWAYVVPTLISENSIAPSITCLISILAFVGCINCLLKCFDRCCRPSSSPSQITTIPIVTTTVESAVPMVPITPSAPDDTTITIPETDQSPKHDEPPKYDQLPENDQPPNYDECVRANCVNINSLEFV